MEHEARPPAPERHTSVIEERLAEVGRQVGLEITKARKTEQTPDQALAHIEGILTQATGGPIVDVGPVPPGWVEEAIVAEREPPTGAA